jgi:hypothetical protein
MSRGSAEAFSQDMSEKGCQSKSFVLKSCDVSITGELNLEMRLCAVAGTGEMTDAWTILICNGTILFLLHGRVCDGWF